MVHHITLKTYTGGSKTDVKNAYKKGYSDGYENK